MPKPLAAPTAPPATLDWDLWLGPVQERPSVSGPEPDPDRTPKSLVSRLDFPARRSASGGELLPVSVHWYQGRPPILDTIGIDAPNEKGKRPSQGMNTLFIGTDATLLCGFDDWRLYEKGMPVEASPPRTLTPSPGFHKEWIAACKGGPAATCAFDYTGPLSEAVLLANIAYRVQGEFAWDAASMTSCRADVDALLRREYRTGWKV